MDEITINSRSPMSKLGTIKYTEWEKSMYGRLMSVGGARIVTGGESPPLLEPNNPTSYAAWSSYHLRSDRAAGEIYQWLDEGNKIHVDAIRDKPKEMWDKLKTIHSKSAPNARFNSLSDLFSIRKRDDESLTDLCTRIEGAMQRIRMLRPLPIVGPDGVTTQTYTIETLDDELSIMAMLRALPREEYGSFISSVLMLNRLTKEAVLEAFRTEETQRRGAEEEATATAAAVAAAAARTITCYLCDGTHKVQECPNLQTARTQIKKDNNSSKSKKSRSRKGKQEAKEAKTEPAKVEAGCDGPAVKAEAAVCRSALLTMSSPDVRWNTDSGATSHMTPHREWFIPESFISWRVPIHVANGTVIHSEGRGSIRFRPRDRDQDNKPLNDVVIFNVLFVPELANNLLSITTLAVHRGFTITFNSRKVQFNIDNETVMMATIDQSLTSYLDGDTMVPALPGINGTAHAAFVTSTHIDKHLLHRRMCHLGSDRLDTLIKHNLSEDLITVSGNSMPNICKPCLEGKQHRASFPHTADRATEVLGRVFSDVHGPMQRGAHETNRRWWATFVDDCTRWMEAYDMFRKSDTFEAFKLFKAQIERQSGKTLKCLHHDKGGEYISREFLDYCRKSGIRLEFTNVATPQQNGVAERLNRTIKESIIAMLAEAGLPESFWAHALGAYRHVHNRSPTSALPGNMTPFEAYKGRKPRIGHLRVFGCAAYVLVGRDKRRGLKGHTLPGIFIGYPSNHVGWKVYVPRTRKIVVSRDVIFDETCFPGLSLSDMPPLPPSTAFDDLPAYEPYDSFDPITPTASTNVDITYPDEPLTPIDEDDSDSVGVPAERVGANQPSEPVPVGDNQPSDSVPILRAPRQPRPPPPPREPSQRIRLPARDRDAEYYDAVERQANHESPLVRDPPPPPPPSPQSDAPMEEALWDINIGDVDGLGEQEVALTINANSTEAAMAVGRVFVKYGEDVGEFDALHVDSITAYKVGAHDKNPRSYREAMASDEAAEWHKAMCEEMNALKNNGTWRAVYLPPGRKAIGSRWVFKVKHLPDGAIERFKARVVAQGFSQRPGVDFDETFAPTARWAAVRTILALAAYEDMYLESVDISSAFLHGVVDADLYMKFPEGFAEEVPPDVEQKPGEGPPCAKLEKGIYGLKQSANLWHKRMHEVFLKIGFSRITSDPCVYVYLRGEVRIIVPIHVDDMTFASKSRSAILKTIAELRKFFKLRHLGPTTALLGVVVTRDRPNRKLWIDQRAYAIDVLSRFNMLDSKAVQTPLDSSVRLSKADAPSTQEEIEEMRTVPYIQATGALLYLAMCTRPDIAFAVGVLCRFNSCAGPKHWKAVKHLMRYIRGTLDYKIEYSANPAFPLFAAYTDSDHGGNPDNGRSTSGSILLVAGGAVSWMSKLQTLVALSSTEAEFVAASETGRELCWLRNFLADIGIPQSAALVLNIDNQSAIRVSKQPEHMGRLKHLDRHWFWLRQAVDDGKIRPVYIPTEDMAADLLTKPLPRVLVDKLRRIMGLVGEFSRTDLQ